MPWPGPGFAMERIFNNNKQLLANHREDSPCRQKQVKAGHHHFPQMVSMT
jgi:hypothetical protein